MPNELQPDVITPNPNSDFITGEPGSHPVATAAGAAAACAAGAALGSMAGPIGTAVGGVAGAIAGGLGGSAVGESVDPTVEDTAGTISGEAYAKGDHPYGDHIPGYRAGYEGHRHYVVETTSLADDVAAEKLADDHTVNPDPMPSGANEVDPGKSKKGLLP